MWGKLVTALLSLFLLTSFHQAHRYHTLCFPENDMSFPENDMSFPENAKLATGLSKPEFDLVLDEFEGIMWFEVNNAEGGARLVVERLWNNDAVNAYAVPYGIYRQVTFFGGLARHPNMTTDALRMVACHELGHHLAGRPYWEEKDSLNPTRYIAGSESWASSEGESDYYASLKCFRHLIIEGEKNNYGVKSSDLTKYPPAEVAHAKVECEKSFTMDQDLRICVRSSLAGLVLGQIFKSRFIMREPSLKSPASEVVLKTDFKHPRGQCRTDTYFQGSLCSVTYRNSVHKDDPSKNTCSRKQNYSVGLRPLCWYKPS